MASLCHVPSVVFLDILDQYCYNADLTCNFKFNTNHESQKKGNVAIFKLGWTQITEYLAIKSVSQVEEDKTSSVTFSRHVLPKETTDLYHLCYINGNDLQGASTPFQFCADENFEIISESSTKALCASESLPKYHIIAEKDKEINRLKEENDILRESLKILISSKTKKSNMENHDDSMNEIKDVVNSLKATVLTHSKDIEMLKNKITEGGEEYKRLYMEKYRLQKKYEKLKSATDKMYLHENIEPNNEFHLDIDDLKSIPPFPSILKP